MSDSGNAINYSGTCHSHVACVCVVEKWCREEPGSGQAGGLRGEAD